MSPADMSSREEVGPAMDAALRASLEHPRYEIVPARGIEVQLAHLPTTATVTVTSSPTHGLEATLDLVELLVARGHRGRVVPHLAARLVTGAAHLRSLLGRLEASGVREVFVIAGDAPTPAGPYEGASALLEAMHELDHGLDDIGITGYPEPHAFIPDATTIQAMFDKAPYATYVVSQICYDPTVTRAWIAAVRARGIELPIHIGLPGVVDRTRLLRISARVGLGDSIRFLGKQGQVAARLLSGYTPDPLIHGLGDLVADPDNAVPGWHLFTFNEIARTEQWRARLLGHPVGAG